MSTYSPTLLPNKGLTLWTFHARNLVAAFIERPVASALAQEV